jgi:hypothetical protein
VVFKEIGAMVMREDEKNSFLQVLEDGLIGANLLKCCVWQFNFQEMKIVITDKIDKLDHLMNAIQVPFKPISIQHSPNIRITLNDEDTIDVQFDTGSKGFLTFSSPSLLALVDSGDAVALHRRSISPIESQETDTETYHLALLKSLKRLQDPERKRNGSRKYWHRVHETFHCDHRLAQKPGLFNTYRRARNEAQYKNLRADLRLF